VAISSTLDARNGGGHPASSVRAIGLLLVRRLASALIVLWGAVTVTFLALQLVPGSIEDAIIGTSPVTPEVRQEIVKEYALDESLPNQYLHYLWRLLHGDLGRSYNQGLDVSTAIGQQIGSTFSLLITAVILAVVLSVVSAVFTANRPRWIRGPVAAFEVISSAIPAFWLGILLLTVFSFQLHWFPVIGSNSPRGLVLPAIALAVAPAALLSQVLRQGLERTLDEPFITTARSRGTGRSALLLRHALRHALLPVVTMTGWLAGAFIGGAVVIESVFSRQGLGQLTVGAIHNKDFPLVSGVVLISAAFYVVVNFLVDAIYPLLDPRLRGASAAPRLTRKTR
jgi:peptide/nickel transport system permease protein